MKVLTTVALFLISAVAGFASPLVLSDGRTFDNWAITRETASAVIVKHDGGLAKVDKKLLPAELLAKYPLDPAAVALEAASLAQSERQGKARLAMLEAQRKRERDLLEQRSKDEKNQQRLKQLVDDHDNLAESRGGLWLPFRGAEFSYGSLVVEMRNVTDKECAFNWTELQVKMPDGSIVNPVRLVPSKGDKEGKCLVPPHESRKFFLGLEGAERPSQVSWKEDEWRSDKGAWGDPVITIINPDLTNLH